MINQNLAYFIWDPPRDIVVIPYINHPITWYGFLFALGFFVGYFFTRRLFYTHLIQSSSYNHENASLASVTLSDRLAVFIILGTVFGARLGHVFFYGWPYYKEHPQDILKVWEGGLASHGGAIGIFVGMVLFILIHRKKYPTLTLLSLLDTLVIPTAFAAGCIRIGNFINQEILGNPTTLPWGVIFLHPVDGIKGVPLHPVQLYEAFFYLVVCLILFLMWKKKPAFIGLGMLSGLFFVLIFGFRFLIEFLKMPQSLLIEEGGRNLHMGQLLSIPFVCLGIFLILRYYLKYKVNQ